MKHIFTAILFSIMACFSAIGAQYTDVPFSLSNGQFTYDGYTFSVNDGYYQEWDHYVIFWSTGYGQQSGTPTTIGSGNYLLNLTQMKTYAEACYDSYTSLGFLDPTEFGHKIIILAYYTTDWVATGSGTGEYGLLNICHASANPSAENPYYTYCHEIAHAYQYLGNMKNGGNAGFQYGDYYGYVSYYECCGNWQAAQVYKNVYFSAISPVFTKTTNLAFGNQWHCYQSYLMNDYFCEKRSKTAIGDIWTVNTNVKYADAVEKYMSIYNLSAEEVYREFFMGAMRMATWDLDRWSEYLAAEGKSCTDYMDHTPGTKAAKNSATTTPATYNENCWQHASTYQYVTTNSSSAIHQVAYSSAPQSTGYNIIQLNVPSGSNRTVTTTFTALEPGCSLASGDNKEYWVGNQWATTSSITNYNSSQTSECNSNYSTYKNWRGFRLGYVTYNNSTGERNYNFTDKVYCTGTDESSVSIQFDVPENVDYLYLVVSPALSNYLRMGAQNPYEMSSDAQFVSAQKERDQWPYRVQFYNTNIYGLSNPSTTFSGTADAGTTYTTSQMPDLGTGEGTSGSTSSTEKTYTLQKDVVIDNSDETTTSATVTLSTADLTALAEGMGIDYTTFAYAAMSISDYTETQNANSLMFMPATADCQLASGASNCTSGSYTFGHWFTTAGVYTSASSSDAALYSQFAPLSQTFNVGMATPANGTYTVCQALRYYDGSDYATAFIKFNITVKGTVHHSSSTVDIYKSIQFDTSDSEYYGGDVELTDEDFEKIAACFGISAENIKSSDLWESWASNGPSEGKITLYGVESDGVTLKDTCSTALGYGHWFNTSNNVCAYGDNSSLYAEYSETEGVFAVGQMPSVMSDGDENTITEAIVFTESGSKYIAYVHISVTTGEKTSVGTVPAESHVVGIYSPEGIVLKELRKGINIVKMSDGSVRKLYIR